MQELINNLRYLKLDFASENIEMLLKESLNNKTPALNFFEQIISAEVAQKKQRATERRIKAAKIPIIKTIDNFNFAHPDKIEPEKIRFLFRLNFLEKKENVIFCGGVGTGKSHLASALAYKACTKGFSVLFTTAVDLINRLKLSRREYNLEKIMHTYIKPQLLVIDELGYMPVDKEACDLFFQIVSKRYEQGSIIITTNRAYKEWPIIFNNDATVTSAILDRLAHHIETITIEGPSYRMTGK